MEIYQLLLWIVFPYSVSAVVGMGLIWQLDAPGGNNDNSKSQYVIKAVLRTMLILSALSGFWMMHFSDDSHHLLLWVASLIQFKPDLNLITNSSIILRAHFIIVFLFLLLLAFTNKVTYLYKPHLYIKSLMAKSD